MTLNIGPQHPATHGTLRIVVKLDGEQVVAAEPVDGLHAPRLREAHRGPHLPAGHDAHQPHRLAGQLRQRGAVHPRRRAADGRRGAAPRAVDPHDPLRDGAHRQHRRCSSATWALQLGAHHAGLLRVPRPRARPQPDRGRHRRSLPPELRPHRRPQGRPAQGLDRRDQGGDGAASATFCDEMEDLSSATRSSRPAPAASASSRPTSPCATACRAPTCAPAASTGTCAATATRAARVRHSSTGRSGRTPTATRSPATGCASRRPARRRKIVDQLLDGIPAGPIMAKVPAHHQGAGGRGLRRDREPARRDGLLRRHQGRPRPVPGEDPLGSRSTTSRSCRGCCAASTCPTSSRSWPASTSSSETSIDDACAASSSPTGSRRSLRVARRARRGPAARRHARLRLPVQDGQLHAEPARPDGGRARTARCSCSPRSASSSRRKTSSRPRPTAALQAGAVRRRRHRAARATSSSRSAPTRCFADLDVGIFFALAVSSLSVIGILMAGWASANKYSLLGGLRAAGQLIAYELPMVLAVVGVVIQAGTLNMQGIVAAQANGEIFGFGRHRQPVHPHAVRRLRHLPDRHAGRAHADAVRHAGRRVRARRRLHDRVLGHALPALLHRASSPPPARSPRIAATLFLGGWYLPGLDLDANDMNVVGPLVLFGKIMLIAVRHLLGALHLSPLP